MAGAGSPSGRQLQVQLSQPAYFSPSELSRHQLRRRHRHHVAGSGPFSLSESNARFRPGKCLATRPKPFFRGRLLPNPHLGPPPLKKPQAPPRVGPPRRQSPSPRPSPHLLPSLPRHCIPVCRVETLMPWRRPRTRLLLLLWRLRRWSACTQLLTRAQEAAEQEMSEDWMKHGGTHTHTH